MRDAANLDAAGHCLRDIILRATDLVCGVYGVGAYLKTGVCLCVGGGVRVGKGGAAYLSGETNTKSRLSWYLNVSSWL